MKIAMAIVPLLSGALVFAATSAAVAEGSSATNAAPVKAIEKAPKHVRPQCEATTLSGNCCKRHAVEGSKYCRQHEAILRKRAAEITPDAVSISGRSQVAPSQNGLIEKPNAEKKQ